MQNVTLIIVKISLGFQFHKVRISSNECIIGCVSIFVWLFMVDVFQKINRNITLKLKAAHAQSSALAIYGIHIHVLEEYVERLLLPHQKYAFTVLNLDAPYFSIVLITRFSITPNSMQMRMSYEASVREGNSMCDRKYVYACRCIQTT